MDFLYQAVLAIIISLSRYLPQDQAEIMAHQITATAQTREDAAMMLTVSYYETGFRTRGGVIPFGMSCCPRLCRNSLQDCAAASLRGLQRALRCSRRMDRAFGMYHTGRCVPDPYSTREAVTYQRILRRL
jgi:hypothetical protein